MKNIHSKTLAAAILCLALPLAPAAHAAPRGDTGVGPAIAAQGNLALQLIKAELDLAIKNWRPAVAAPAPKPAAVKARARTAAAGGIGLAGTVHCAR